MFFAEPLSFSSPQRNLNRCAASAVSAFFFLPSSARRSHLETMVGPAEKQWLGLSYHKPTAVYLGGGWATYHYHWLVILSINLWFILMVIILLIMVNIYILYIYMYIYIYIWVVVDLPLWNIDEFVSWDYYPQYIIWKNDKCSKPTRYGLYNYITLMTMGNAGSLINLDAYIKDDYGLSTINQRYIVYKPYSWFMGIIILVTMVD